MSKVMQTSKKVLVDNKADRTKDAADMYRATVEGLVAVESLQILHNVSAAFGITAAELYDEVTVLI